MSSGPHQTLKLLIERELADAHIKDGIIRIIHYHTSNEGLNLAERILREKFNLVSADGFKGNPNIEGLGLVPHDLVLVYENSGPKTGLYRVHFYKEEGSNDAILRFNYWDNYKDGRKIPEELYKRDLMRCAMETVYWAIRPHRISGSILDIEVGVPWDEIREKRA